MILSMGTCARRFRHAFLIESSNEIIAYLFCVATLLASSNNHDDNEGNEKIIKKQQLY